MEMKKVKEQMESEWGGKEEREQERGEEGENK